MQRILYTMLALMSFYYDWDVIDRTEDAIRHTLRHEHHEALLALFEAKQLANTTDPLLTQPFRVLAKLIKHQMPAIPVGQLEDDSVIDVAYN